jgi:hypothetical protein
MSFPTLRRRTIVKSGAIYAGALAMAGGLAQANPTSVQANPAAVNGPLIGWLRIAPDGGSRLTIFEVDARSSPVRQVMAVAAGPATSVAGAVREANNAALRSVASLWNVPAADCAFEHSGIRHTKSGRIIPLSIWTDFA